MFTEEEQSSDAETGHVNETVGFFIINPGPIMGIAVSVPEVLLGDVNLDGVVNFLDVFPFISLLNSDESQLEADLNQDGEVNFLDITLFIQALSNG